jgi:transposase
VIARVRAGKPQKQTADDLGIHPVTLSKWINQDDIDRGARPGVPSSESTELREARRRIREVETELAIVLQAAELLQHKRTPTTPTALRQEWLTGLIREVHVASRGTYGYRRVHAELTLVMEIAFSVGEFLALGHIRPCLNLPVVNRWEMAH